MAAKKTEAKKKKAEKAAKKTEEKAPKLGKDTAAFLAFVGKTVTDLRKTMAGALGSISRLEDEERVVRAGLEEVQKKVRKLVVDPIYSVPEKTAKELAQVKSKLEALTTRHNVVSGSLDDLERRFKKLKTAEEASAHVEGLDDKLGTLEQRLNDLEGEFGSLQEELGVKPKASEAAPAAPVDGAQVTLDEAIERAKTEGDPDAGAAAP